MTTEHDYARTLADTLERAEGAGSWDWLFLPLLRLLANGEPVTVAEIAAATGRTTAEVEQALAASPSVERVEHDRIVGGGLTLRPTPHRFELDDGPRLYTWCALDTLFFPAVLGRTAHVESPCHGTGAPVRLTVTPTDVTGLDPTGAVVSLVTPDDASHIRASFCDQVHFFASADAAAPWLRDHPEASVLPVPEAYDLGRELARHLQHGIPPSGC